MKSNYEGEESMMNDQRNPSGRNGRDKVARPSRAEIESLCLLDVIGDSGATVVRSRRGSGFLRSSPPPRSRRSWHWLGVATSRSERRGST